MHSYNWNWGMGMGIWWILGLVLIIAIVWFIFRAGSPGSRSSQDKSALDLLNERYARGRETKTNTLK